LDRSDSFCDPFAREGRFRLPCLEKRAWALAAVLALVALALPPLQPAYGFGTVNLLGQHAEHERITRAALACAPGVASTGDCFEPRSIDQLAGHTGTFGAVGSPDSDEVFGHPEAHCDDADYLNVPGYPQSRAAATAQLQACVDHLRMRFRQGRDAAAALLRPDGTIDPVGVNLSSDCTFFGGVPGRAKCNVLEGFGRALHGIQDFYSHSNWADQSDASRPIGIDNPPGLNRSAPSPLLDLVGSGPVAPPVDLSTGFFKTVLGVIPSDNCPGSDGRITHACLNKDTGQIDPVTGAASALPGSPQRARVGTNFSKAVRGAITETRRQWADFRAQLVARYGPVRAGQMIRALTRDVP
jgi:hypothetical protein